MRVAVAAVAVALVALMTLGAPTSSAHAEDYPSQQEVDAAKHDAKKKAAEVGRIQGLLGRLEDRAAVLGAAALAAEAKASRARADLHSAEATVTDLRRRATMAADRAAADRRQAGVVTTQLYRSGDPTITVWLSGAESRSLLYRLGALSQISASSAAMLQQAVIEERQVGALGDQAGAAKRVRDALAASAGRLAETATETREAADAQVAETERHTRTLQAQLRQLTATYVRTKDQYEQGVQAKAAAAAAGNGVADGTIGAGPGTGSLSPDGARSYAAGRLGAYGWGSSGQSECLGYLWYRESGWRWDAYNTSSGAYGIPQSLPASKMASAGPDWRTSSGTQIEWGLGYIRARYGSPCGAWAHETSIGWY